MWSGDGSAIKLFVSLAFETKSFLLFISQTLGGVVEIFDIASFRSDWDVTSDYVSKM